MINLKLVDPVLKLSPNVVIVGSSGNLCGKNLGNKINQFTDVIRFNRAPTKGYENIVGNKTTLRVANNHVFINLAPGMKGFTNQPKDFIRNLRNTRILYMGPGMKQENKEKHTHSSNELYVFKFGNLGPLKNSVGFCSASDPSVGCIMICLCVIVGIKPTLFGFDLDIKNTSRTHYWEGRPQPGPCHKIGYEKQFLLNLIKQNKVQYG